MACEHPVLNTTVSQPTTCSWILFIIVNLFWRHLHPLMLLADRLTKPTDRLMSSLWRLCVRSFVCASVTRVNCGQTLGSIEFVIGRYYPWTIATPTPKGDPSYPEGKLLAVTVLTQNFWGARPQLHQSTGA